MAGMRDLGMSLIPAERGTTVFEIFGKNNNLVKFDRTNFDITFAYFCKDVFFTFFAGTNAFNTVSAMEKCKTFYH